ncbi:MAG: T9SS type A sorting domain-containing protein [Bacteroidota bacterium]|nr:T9SS type A sorting domain-containing protein [Bacteroidota bacterium]MDP4233145.1 T9SS type A sorting domain-containing protein [Bacteroidota bacterium]MDP4241710.1 T9SS type A sorting domain-containing protein [Bacteroidota bacterium]MDP4287368.1 T9SS type A sorting domain-containing protein [Bacteroidota bacterium]
MKRIITILILASLSSAVRAQITISEADFLSLGTRGGTDFSSTDTTGVRALENLSGVAATWDFGGRAYTQSETAGTDLLPYPSGAALANDPDFTSATNVIKLVASDGTITWDFLKLDATGLWILGASQDSLGNQSKVLAYQPPLQQFAFPLTYGTTWQSSSSVVSPMLPPGATITQSSHARVDGYGTLIAGGVSSQTLRLREKDIMSTSASFGGFTFTQTDTTYNFSWITKGAYSASISADSALRPQGVSYSVASANSAVNQGAVLDDPLTLRLSINPASNTETQLSYSMKDAGPVEVALMDYLGRNVRMVVDGWAQAGQNIIPIDPKTLEPGTYFIHLMANGMNATQKLVITR